MPPASSGADPARRAERLGDHRRTSAVTASGQPTTLISSAWAANATDDDARPPASPSARSGRRPRLSSGSPGRPRRTAIAQQRRATTSRTHADEVREEARADRVRRARHGDPAGADEHDDAEHGEQRGHAELAPRSACGSGAARRRCGECGGLAPESLAAHARPARSRRRISCTASAPPRGTRRTRRRPGTGPPSRCSPAPPSTPRCRTRCFDQRRSGRPAASSLIAGWRHQAAPVGELDVDALLL